MKRLWWMLLSLLLAVTMLGSCGETTGTGEYALRISLEEEYVPDEGRLSFLPWMSEYSRVLSVLEERGVPSEKITETESDGVRRLEVVNKGRARWCFCGVAGPPLSFSPYSPRSQQNPQCGTGKSGRRVRRWAGGREGDEDEYDMWGPHVIHAASCTSRL